MNRILDWAEANLKPNLWALLLFAVLLRSGYQFHEIQKPTQWMGAILVILLLALFGVVALRGFVRQLATALRRSSSSGFTLIEIAIVLVVVGLISSFGLSAFSRVGDGRKQFETKQRMAEVERALLGFVIENGCLPCPADPAGTSGTQASGAVPCGAATCTYAAGALPWVTLGLSEEQAADGWGRRLTYGISNSFHRSPDCAAASNLYSVRRCTNNSVAFPQVASNEEITVEVESSSGVFSTIGSTTTPYAYFLISHGVDGSFGRTLYTAASMADRYGQAAGAPNLGQAENGDGDRNISARNTDISNSVDYFDDIVIYRGASALILSCGSGSCGNP